MVNKWILKNKSRQLSPKEQAEKKFNVKYSEVFENEEMTAASKESIKQTTEFKKFLYLISEQENKILNKTRLSGGAPVNKTVQISEEGSTSSAPSNQMKLRASLTSKSASSSRKGGRVLKMPHNDFGIISV